MKHLWTAAFILVLSVVAAEVTWGDITSDLVASWPLNGDAADASGNGHNGTIHGGVTFAPDRNGVPAAAARFDGVNGYIDIGSGVKPPFPLTVAMWTNFSETGHAIFRNDVIDDNEYRYGVNLRRGTDRRIYAYYFSGYSHPQARVGYYSVDPVAVAGEWHHLAVVYQGHRNVHIYWDGQEIAGSYDDGYGSGMTYSSAPGALGHYHSGADVYLAGLLDDVRVYNRGLSPAEVQELYAYPSPVGACCRPDSTCTVTVAGACLVPSEWRGPGTWCSPNPCLPPGPNAHGMLIVHDAALLMSATNGSNSVCLQGSVPTHCWEADARIDSPLPSDPSVFKVYAAFPEDRSPRLMGLTWGVHYDGHLVITSSGRCGDFELNDNGWPGSGRGSSVTWDAVQTGVLVPVYWFAAYTDGAATSFRLGPHPALGGGFGDDSVPAVLDPIAGYGSLGFNSAGTRVCPGPGACCLSDGSCSLIDMEDCDQPGVWHGEWSTCVPNPCVQTGACCDSGGECAVVAQPACQGLWLGAGTNCEPNLCPTSGLSDSEVSGELRVMGAVPNPFTGMAEIRYELAARGPFLVEVFDPSGRLVRRLPGGVGAAGIHASRWDGLDDSGRRVPGGVYYARVSSGGRKTAAVVIRLR